MPGAAAAGPERGRPQLSLGGHRNSAQGPGIRGSAHSSGVHRAGARPGVRGPQSSRPVPPSRPNSVAHWAWRLPQALPCFVGGPGPQASSGRQELPATAQKPPGLWSGRPVALSAWVGCCPTPGRGPGLGRGAVQPIRAARTGHSR